MKFALVVTLSCLVLLAAVPAKASVVGGDTIISLKQGDFDSGWQALLSSDQAAKNITDINVDPELGTVTISITKDFGAYSEDQFPTASIVFQPKPGAQPFSRIIVASETVYNNTTLPWTAFVWKLDPIGAAKFNTNETNWNVSPFNSQAWTDQSGSTANTLLAFNGIVPNGTTFTPNGSLVIDVNMAAGAPNFWLKEYVVPEPGTIGLLAVASLGWFRRKRPVPLAQ